MYGTNDFKGLFLVQNTLYDVVTYTNLMGWCRVKKIEYFQSET